MAQAFRIDGQRTDFGGASDVRTLLVGLHYGGCLKWALVVDKDFSGCKLAHIYG